MVKQHRKIAEGSIMKLIPVVLCGGSGTRLWPKSREDRPKQFSQILEDRSLFEQTLVRIKNLKSTAQFNVQPPIIVASNNLKTIVKTQLNQSKIQNYNLIFEPEAKNTGPAVLAACHFVQKHMSNGVLLIMPCDHYISDDNCLNAMLQQASPHLNRNRIVTFGLPAVRPETGYGYIERGDNDVVLNFVEKPTLEVAQEMISSDNYFWNSGIFMAHSEVILEEINNLIPSLSKAVRTSLDQAYVEEDHYLLDEETWGRLTPVSIDHSLMEMCGNLMVVPFSGRWVDLGDWYAVWQEFGSIEKQNLLGSNSRHGNCFRGNVVQVDTDSCFIFETTGEQVVGVAGLKDLVIVADKDAILVAHKNQVQDVKKLVHLMAEKGFKQVKQDAREDKPWGWFEVLDLSEMHQVKKIVVYPNEKLSLQSHKFRQEQWLVTDGVATVQIDSDITTLNVGQSAHINFGQIHRLINDTNEPVCIIEIQTGSYFGEDDIMRYEDKYGR